MLNDDNCYIEEKYPISIFKENEINFSWNTIKVGWDLKLLNVAEINIFAMDYIKNNQKLTENKYITELIADIQKIDIDEVLYKIFESLNLVWPEKEKCLWNQEWRKWRFCILSTMIKNISDKNQLLCKIDHLYSILEYPIDMSPLLSDEVYEFIIKRLAEFLLYEKILIDTDYEYLPERIGEQKVTIKFICMKDKNNNS